MPNALTLLRIVVAVLLGLHGVARAFYGAVAPFGGFLVSKGVPLGHELAWAITVFEVVGAVLLALDRYTRVVAVGFIAILATGVGLVHAPAGWFVVGLNRNGVEYSVLLITCLVAVILGASRRS